MNKIEVSRNGRSYERFPGRGKGYDIVAYNAETLAPHGEGPIGHATRSLYHDGTPVKGTAASWVVWDYTTGEILVSSADVNGPALNDALFSLERKLRRDTFDAELDALHRAQKPCTIAQPHYRHYVVVGHDGGNNEIGYWCEGIPNGEEP